MEMPMPPPPSPPAPLSPPPLALLSLQASDGTLRLLPAGWVGIVCARTRLLTVGVRAAAMLEGVRPGGHFSVSLPSGGPPAAPALLLDCRLRTLARRCELTLLCGEVLTVRLPGESPRAAASVDLASLLAGGRRA